MSQGALERGQILGASQDGSWAFISLLATIYVDSTYLLPALIYKGKSHNLMDTWLEDFTDSDNAYFGYLEAG